MPLTDVENCAIGVTCGVADVLLLQPTNYWKNAAQQALPFTLNPSILYRGVVVNAVNNGTCVMSQFFLKGPIERSITGGKVRKLSDVETVAVGEPNPNHDHHPPPPTTRLHLRRHYHHRQHHTPTTHHPPSPLPPPRVHRRLARLDRNLPYGEQHTTTRSFVRSFARLLVRRLCRWPILDVFADATALMTMCSRAT